MIVLFVNLLVICLVFGVIWWIVSIIPLPSPFGRVAQVIIALIFILVLLNMFFGGGAFPVHMFER